MARVKLGAKPEQGRNAGVGLSCALPVCAQILFDPLCPC